MRGERAESMPVIPVVVTAVILGIESCCPQVETPSVWLRLVDE
jgi:hypothetical protein